jgi:hypothetical protein
VSGDVHDCERIGVPHLVVSAQTIPDVFLQAVVVRVWVWVPESQLPQSLYAHEHVSGDVHDCERIGVPHLVVSAQTIPDVFLQAVVVRVWVPESQLLQSLYVHPHLSDVDDACLGFKNKINAIIIANIVKIPTIPPIF